MGLRSIRAALLALASDRASRLAAAIGGSLVACLVLLGLYLCLDLRDGAWRGAERNADNLLALIEEGVGRNVRLYDESLRETAGLASRPEIVALDPEIRRLALFDTMTRAGGLGRIAVSDAAGRVLYGSDDRFREIPDLSDTPEFQAHRVDPAAGLVLVGPVRSRVTGRTVLRASRRIEGPGGAFAGIVIGAIYLDYFQSLFERLRIEEGSAVNIFHRDGHLLVRTPFETRLAGSSIAAGPTYRHYRTHERGRYVGRASLDGRERMFAFANLDGLPLIVTVAVALDSIRAAWVYKAAAVAALVLCLSALTLCLTLLLQREIGRRARREESSRADNAALSLLARTDGLTGLPNRRCYDEALAAEWQRAARAGTSLSLLVVDADHFKQFNDRFGHHRGDAALKAMAECLAQVVDPAGGLSCRIGGEEFAALLPGHDAASALGLAERVRRAVAALRIEHAPELGGVATVSVGLASARPGDGSGPESLFAQADAALYAAKDAGRNRVRAAAAEASAGLALSA